MANLQIKIKENLVPIIIIGVIVLLCIKSPAQSNQRTDTETWKKFDLVVCTDKINNCKDIPNLEPKVKAESIPTQSTKTDKYSNWTEEINIVNKKWDSLIIKNGKVFDFNSINLTKIYDSQSFYEKAKGCDWRIMASIHYRESGLQVVPPNKEGIFGDYSGNWNAKSDPVEQLQKACDHLKSKVKSDLLDINNKGLVCEALWKYNGIGNGTSCNTSAYTSNFMTQDFMTQCAVNGCKNKSINTTAGALVIIAKLLTK